MWDAHVLQVKKAAGQGYEDEKPTARKGGKGRGKGKQNTATGETGKASTPSETAGTLEAGDKKREAEAAPESKPAKKANKGKRASKVSAGDTPAEGCASGEPLGEGDEPGG